MNDKRECFNERDLFDYLQNNLSIEVSKSYDSLNETGNTFEIKLMLVSPYTGKAETLCSETFWTS